MKSIARVKVELEVQLSDSWSKDCTLAVIQDQAKRSALNKVFQIIKNLTDITTVGDPKVTAILIEED